MKSIRRITLVVTMAGVAACCAHQDQRPEKLVAASGTEVITPHARYVRTVYVMARRDLLACGNAVYGDPHFSSISVHIPFNPDFSSLAQLNDRHFATRREIARLFDFDRAFAKCPTAYLERMKTNVPAMALITAEGYAKNEYITADLIERKLTWGDYAKIRKKNYDDAVQLLGVEFVRFLNGTSPESEADPLLRQDVAAALTRYYQSLRIVPSIRTKSAKPSS